MTGFEQMLIDKGYLKFILNCKTMKYEKAKGHVISTMTNLDHRYFHKDDNVLKKIEAGKSVIGKDITWEDRKGEICFGLHEILKPPTLISPRPRMFVKRMKDGNEVFEDERSDDNMNIVLRHMPYNEILIAMYDRSICYEVDLIKKIIRIYNNRNTDVVKAWRDFR